MQPPSLPAAVVRATVEADGIQLPAEAVEALDAGRRPPVRVTIGERTYRSRIAVRGGGYRVPLRAAGDEVDVAIELDRDPRVVVVPSDLAAALEAAPDALHYFESLSYRRQRWFVLNVENARTPETRARRIVNAVTKLRAV